ncbi:MAG TPA: cupredoxin domain-containing protein [Bacilli bacterium]
MKKAALALVSAALILSLAACGGNKDDNSAASDNTNATANTEIVLHASNFKYDQEEYHVKAGEPVKITLDEQEGVHGAESKELGFNLDPNKKSVVITPEKPGTYEIKCSVPCGTGHADMKTKLVVE